MSAGLNHINRYLIKIWKVNIYLEYYQV